MPDTPSHSDDSFAELFGALPDPRTRPARPPQTPATGGGADTPPSSRRAAREAAARSATASTHPDRDESALFAAVPQAPVRSIADPVTDMRAAAVSRSATATASSPASGTTLEALFSGEKTTADIGQAPPPPDRKKRHVAAWIALGLVLAIVGGVAAGGLWVWNTYEDNIRAFMGWEEPKDYEAGLATGETLVTIASGDTGATVSQSLFDAGVTKTPEAFYDMLVDTAQNPVFYPGVYQLQQKMTSAAALAALEDPASKLENSALVREGLTVDQTLPLLAEGLGLPIEDFEAAVTNPADYGVPAETLEGWLFPAMYTFDPGATATDVIATMVNRTVESLNAAGVPEADRERILIIASIIQREARFEADFYKVSRVIQNRLDPGNQETFGLLQMDSTAQYGYGELHDGTVSTSGEALTDDNPWNTYVYTGLPIGPIANPGDVAIDAAMNPADGPWLYFVTVNLYTGETIFTSTLPEHERAIEQWRAWCTDNPDAGC